MTSEIIYHCTGTCNGTSQEPKKCGSTTCDQFGQPLTAFNQCAGCAAAVERDQGVHWCGKCQPVETE